MRWIFITLAVANIVTLIWALLASPEEPPTQASANQKNPYQKYPQISLLSELGQGSVNTAETLPVSSDDTSKPVEQLPKELAQEPGEAPEIRPSVPTPTSEPVIPKHDNRLLCDMVGPFESQEVAGVFVERLKAVDVASNKKELELPAGMGYWVYLEPVATRREALRTLSELQSKRIDSYVIPKGDLANGISLGMFSKKTLSDARVKKMQAIGLAPQVEEIERTYRELWVMLAPGESSKMSSLTWDRVLEGIKDLERRQNYCLDVASQ